MPPPMVPAPITAARSIFVTGVSFGTSGTFAASRSAKNMCTSARDSSEVTQSANSSRSRASPSSKSSVNAPSMASMALNGACTPFAVLASAARAAAHATTHFWRSVIFSFSSRVFRTLADRRPSTLANSIASVKRCRCRRRRRRCPPASPWRGITRLSGRAHFDRQLGAAEPRQPLRAAGARNDAEQHFRLADFRIVAPSRGSGTTWQSRGRRQARCRGSPPRAASENLRSA